jgi:hypothetical protein
MGVTIYTYDASGSLEDASGNRVMTGATSTLRAWQAIVGWSHAVYDLSAAGYTSGLPYRRVQ